ncbi:hypothetical protein GJ629_04820 [Halapricum sp. CBA1109]|uniref:hypothetical protein n=1 Tax=Halapricum sp. CBA1109 TaxID=2668068 RepID=UPI0012F89778|nr:hypothetical protein [Halapricum sp. CBA1109]MUV89305.1 hypothetical protein [Halapricum sp. CBA1109]
MTAVDDGIPADARAVLVQAFGEAERSLRSGDRETARALITTARTVATNKVPAGERRTRLLDGCERVVSILDGDGNGSDRRALAAEYCAALRAVTEGE